MKFSYRNNFLLFAQNKMPNFGWVDKLEMDQELHDLTYKSMINKEPLEWHVESSCLLQDIFKHKKMKNIYFTESISNKVDGITSINKSITAFKEINNEFGCVIIDNKLSYIYGFYSDKFVAISMCGAIVFNIEVIIYNEHGYDYLTSFNDRPFVKESNISDSFSCGGKLIPLLTVFYFAEIETKIISKPLLRKAVVNKEKFVNETNTPITIVDSRWFTNIISANGFSVKGHFRLQACGEGRKDRKLIWINEFDKSGYVSKAKKTLS